VSWADLVEWEDTHYIEETSSDNFPYLYNSIKLEDLIKLWEQLKPIGEAITILGLPTLQIYLTREINQVPILRPLGNNRHLLFQVSKRQSDLSRDIIDYYTEPSRIRCRFGTFDSAFQIYQQKKIEGSTLLEQRHNFNQSFTKQCHDLPIQAVAKIYQYFGAEVVYNPYCQWGATLLGSGFSNIRKFVGFNLNPEMDEFFSVMEQLFVQEPVRREMRFRVENFDPSKASLKDDHKQIDLIFSYPSLYGGRMSDPTEFDETKKVKGYFKESWNPNFQNVIWKFFRSLKLGGYLILCLEDPKDYSVIRSLLASLNSRKAYFLGVFMIEEGKNFKFCYTWTNQINSSGLSTIGVAPLSFDQVKDLIRRDRQWMERNIYKQPKIDRSAGKK